MKAHSIDIDKLKRDGEFCSLWYQYDEGDLYILLGPNHIEYFEFTKDNMHLEGGRNRGMKFGKIIESDVDEGAQFYKRSRMVEYQSEPDEVMIRWSQRFMFECPNVENILKEGVMGYLEHRGNKAELLGLEEGEYDSYRHPPVAGKPPRNWKKIKKRSLLALVTVLVLIPVIYFINLKRDAVDIRLKQKCEYGDQDSCEKIREAQILTFDKNVKKRLWKKETNTRQSTIDQCLVNDRCNYKVIQKLVRSEDDEVLNKLCIQKLQDWACQKVFKNSFVQYGKLRKKMTLTVNTLSQFCRDNTGRVKSCSNINNFANFLAKDKLCEERASTMDCGNSLDFLVKHGYGKDILPELKDLCERGVSRFCYQLGHELLRDKKHPQFKQRAEQGRKVWRKACFDLSNYKSCYHYSWKLGENPKFDKVTTRKELLRKCNEGSEESCRRIVSLAKDAD